MNIRTQQAGFNLIELMTVVTIAAALAVVAVPSYKYATTSNRVSAEINGLLNDIQFTRYEALKEGMNVTICPYTSSAPNVCDATATNWGEGWIVLSNAADGTLGVSTVLRRQAPFANFNSSDTLTSAIGASAQTSILFNREGFATVLTGTTYGLPTGTVKFSLHDPTSSATFTRCLMVATSGSVNTTTAGKPVYSTTCS